MLLLIDLLDQTSRGYGAQETVRVRAAEEGGVSYVCSGVQVGAETCTRARITSDIDKINECHARDRVVYMAPMKNDFRLVSEDFSTLPP